MTEQPEPRPIRVDHGADVDVVECDACGRERLAEGLRATPAGMLCPVCERVDGEDDGF